ncbi:MAG: DUF4332 domain-containing protein [Acidobacteriota bacterium]|nr:MAG: DUF4332 domain-containing protein [Acidobacteriota bacterium]
MTRTRFSPPPSSSISDPDREGPRRNGRGPSAAKLAAVNVTTTNDLLKAAGVDTVKELRHRSPEPLALKLREINGSKKLAINSPALSLVESWIAQSKILDPRITY